MQACESKESAETINNSCHLYFYVNREQLSGGAATPSQGNKNSPFPQLGSRCANFF